MWKPRLKLDLCCLQIFMNLMHRQTKLTTYCFNFWNLILDTSESLTRKNLSDLTLNRENKRFIQCKLMVYLVLKNAKKISLLMSVWYDLVVTGYFVWTCFSQLKKLKINTKRWHHSSLLSPVERDALFPVNRAMTRGLK